MSRASSALLVEVVEVVEAVEVEGAEPDCIREDRSLFRIGGL
jgi:hypothetical protein